MSDEATELQWWYIVADRRVGPVTWPALQERVREGLLLPADPVWKPGFPYWVAAGNVEGLYAQGTAVAPPPAQPPVYLTPSGKSRLSAALFALLLGSFGAHKFYLGDTGLGVVYLLLFWTGIPGIVGIVEGIIYLTMSDEQFARKYR